MSTHKTEVTVEGRRLALSNLDKVLYPKAGFTKGQVIDYYSRIAAVLVPHLKNHPLTLKRYPQGVEGEFFYEKSCPSFRPRWLKTAPVWSKTRRRKIAYCLVNDLAALVWAANLADLELHTSLSHYPKIGRPATMVFDLDPGPGTGVRECAVVAIWLRDWLARRKLKSFAKTSGSKGLQVYVPLNSPATYDKTKKFSHAVAMIIEREHPDLAISKMSRKLRKDKVFVDWSQNDPHKTTVCVYSLRAKESPTVSTPLKWSEVERVTKSRSAHPLSFEADEVLRRVNKHGDLFEPVLKLKQKLPKPKGSVLAIDTSPG